jgi:lipoprotein-releasing system permease protein
MAGRRSKIFIPWIAWRNLIAKKRGNGLSFMTITSIGGVALGVFALTVVLSVMGGFEKDLREKMFRGLPHLEIMATNPVVGFSLKEHPVEQITKLVPEASGVEAFVQADVVLKHRKHLSSVTIFGIEPEKGQLWGFANAMTQGELSSVGKLHTSATDVRFEQEKYPGLVLGEGLAGELGVDVGDEVTVLSPQSGVRNALAGQSMSSTFVVSGIFRSDLPRFDSKYAVVSLSAGRKFMADYDESLDVDEFVSGIAVNVGNPEEVDTYAKRINKFPGLDTLTWKNVNKSLLFALKLEKFTMGSILLLIVVVAAFSISGTMMMTVFHKRGQVALMRSLGMTRNDILKVYLAHGFSIGTVGITIGLALGLGACAAIYFFHFIDLPTGLYYQRKLPVKFLPIEYCVIAVCAWALSLFAAAYPAFTASRQDPGQGLRYR